MNEVKTIVYFDLEATGLKDSGKPRICEISFVAVSTQDVLQFGLKMNEDRKLSEETFLPRIMNKLTLCVYPMALIVPLVSDLTGLDNYNLSGQSKFNKTTGDLINNFLSCLPSPMCLVAHNGNAYDFPLLKAELEKVGIQLNPEILCADSLHGIKKIFDQQSENIENIKFSYDVRKEIDAATELMNAGMFESELMEGQVGVLIKESTSKLLQDQNELTPLGKCKRNISCLGPSKHKKNSQHAKSKIRKKLGFSSPGSPKSFTLLNLHKHLLGVPPAQSHGSEADCLALLRTTAVLGNDWISWVRDNCYPFLKCEKMWG
jgi:DNA polymerase III epsilon subunit-like protein